MKLQEKHARIVDRAWDTGGLFTCLVHYARAGHDVEWFKTHLDLEAAATELRIWELSWIPGLFQTQDYIRAVIRSAGLTDIDALVAVRMKRQEALDRKPPPLIRVFLDQSAIDQPVGGPEVMKGQLTRLLDLAGLPHISVRIVPRNVGAHVGRDGSFKIMTVGGSEIVYTEACGGGRLVVDATEVRSFRMRFDRVSDQALPIDASISLIEEVLEELH